MSRIYVVRHGEASWHEEDYDQLTDKGHAQARAVGAELAARGIRPDVVVSGTLRRHRETAAGLLEGAGWDHAVAEDDRWNELDYGAWDGVPNASVTPEQWAAWRADATFAPPGGETLVALAARVHEACDELAARAERRDIVVVTHVSPIKAAFGWALGVGIEVSWRCFVAPASIMRIVVGRTGTSLRSFNEIAHLER